MRRRTTTLRGALVRALLLMIVLSSGTLLLATFLGTASAVAVLSRGLIEDAVTLVEIELQLFFGPVRRALESACSWQESGLLAPGDPESVRRVLLPVVGDVDQVGGIGVVSTGVEHRLERRPDGGFDAISHPLGSRPGAGGANGEPDWYAGALARASASAATLDERLYWSAPYLSSDQEGPSDRRLVMTGALACRSGAEDEAPDVVAVDVVLEDLAEFLRGIEVSPRGGVSLMTGDLRLIAYPEGEHFWQGSDPRGWLLRNPSELNSPLVDQAIEAYVGVPPNELGEPVRFFSGGDAWWVQLRQFALAKDSNLIASVMIPTSDLLAERRRFRVVVALVTLAVLAGAMIWALRFARRLSRPLESLVATSDRISRGDLDAEIAVDSRLAEVQVLADAEERMRRGLQESVKRERDLQLARQIQQEALPSRLPSISGYDLAAWSEPADETGGDSYDVIALPAAEAGENGSAVERVILLLADASGHGVGPALVVTQLRAMLRMAVRLHAELPQIVGQMNEQLQADLPRNRFITAWLGELDASRHTLRWLSAGQGPLFHYRAATGEVDAMRATTVPLGIFPKIDASRFEERRLERGDVFAALSDGFFEAENPSGLELGAGRLRELLKHAHARSAGEIVEALRAYAREWTAGQPLADDCSVLVLRRE